VAVTAGWSGKPVKVTEFGRVKKARG